MAIWPSALDLCASSTSISAMNENMQSKFDFFVWKHHVRVLVVLRFMYLIMRRRVHFVPVACIFNACSVWWSVFSRTICVCDAVCYMRQKRECRGKGRFLMVDFLNVTRRRIFVMHLMVVFSDGSVAIKWL